MRIHPVDVTSLAWGIVLATLTTLLALSAWTDVSVDVGLVLPAALICAGALVGVVALLRGPRAATASTDR